MYLNVLHCDLLSTAYEGPILAGDRMDEDAIGELVADGLLEPAAADDYYYYYYEITQDGAAAIEEEGWV